MSIYGDNYHPDIEPEEEEFKDGIPWPFIFGVMLGAVLGLAIGRLL